MESNFEEILFGADMKRYFDEIYGDWYSAAPEPVEPSSGYLTGLDEQLGDEQKNVVACSDTSFGAEQNGVVAGFGEQVEAEPNNFADQSHQLVFENWQFEPLPVGFPIPDQVTGLAFSPEDETCVVQPVQISYQWVVADEKAAQLVKIDREVANFRYEIEEGQWAKAAPWTFSKKMSKLFVNREQYCPIKFKTNIPPQFKDQFRVRAQIQFAEKTSKFQPVLRCNEHKNRDEMEHKPHAQHILHSEHSDVVYDTINDHNTVEMPLESSGGGDLFLTTKFKFGCFNSCHSINRRPTELVMLLVTSSGQVIDRKTLPVQMCSCPGRDAHLKERKLEKDAAKSVLASSASVSKRCKMEANLQQSDIEIFQLPSGHVVFTPTGDVDNGDVTSNKLKQRTIKFRSASDDRTSTIDRIKEEMHQLLYRHVTEPTT